LNNTFKIGKKYLVKKVTPKKNKMCIQLSLNPKSLLQSVLSPNRCLMLTTIYWRVFNLLSTFKTCPIRQRSFVDNKHHLDGGPCVTFFTVAPLY